MTSKLVTSWQDIPGWFDFQDIYDLAVGQAQSGDTFVEIGSYLGKSSAYMGQKIKESGKHIAFHAVDLWNDSGQWIPYVLNTNDPPNPMPPTDDLIAQGPQLNAFRYAMQRCGVGGIVHAMQMPSLSAARQFADKSLRFAFVDASHLYDDVKHDIIAWMPKVMPGGLLAGHDFVALWPGVERAVREVFGDKFEIRGNSWLVRM